MGIKDTQKLKQLQSQRDRVTVQLAEAKDIQKESQREVSELDSKLKSINDEIKRIQAAEPTVTEHALLRYFEHVLGYDIEAMKKCILGDGRSEQIRSIGSGKLPLIEGHKMVVKNNTVVSIYPPHYK